MNKRILARLVMLAVMAANLGGCVIQPWMDDDGREHHQGEYREDHHGDHHADHGGYEERR